MFDLFVNEEKRDKKNSIKYKIPVPISHPLSFYPKLDGIMMKRKTEGVTFFPTSSPSLSFNQRSGERFLRKEG